MDKENLDNEKFCVANKITEGQLITKEEYDFAVENKMFQPHSGMTYEGFKASYYSGKDIQGYICQKHKHHKDSATVEDGKTYLCGFGLHLEDLNDDELTDLNRMFIAFEFGYGALNEVGKTDSPPEPIPTWRNHCIVVLETEFDFSPDEAVEVLSRILKDKNSPMGTTGEGMKFTVLGSYPYEEPK
jgi:hypothetical protein